MALETKGYGFRARKSEFGGTPPTMVKDFPVANNYGTALYAGDVIMVTGGYAVKFVAGAGNVARGVARGFKYIDANGTPKIGKVLPANTIQNGVMEGASTPVVQVEEIEGGLFDVLMSAPMTNGQADINKYYAVLPGTADSVMNQSGAMVDYSTAAATFGATKDVEVLGLAAEPNNDYTNANPKVVVRFVKSPLNQ